MKIKNSNKKKYNHKLSMKKKKIKVLKDFVMTAETTKEIRERITERTPEKSLQAQAVLQVVHPQVVHLQAVQVKNQLINSAIKKRDITWRTEEKQMK